MLGDLERGVERFVELAIARGFRLQVQPAEIGRQLERALLKGTATSVGRAMAPNAFEVLLHPDDLAMFDGWSDDLCREMERSLADLAFRRGLVTIAPIHVSIKADLCVRRRSVHASAQFLKGAAKNPIPEVAPVTRLELTSTDGESPAVLHAVSRAMVGRAFENDLIIDDERVSRRHAVLEWDDGEWRIRDLGSTNGTWVNGRRVSHVQLVEGDEVELGGRRFRVRFG